MTHPAAPNGAWSTTSSSGAGRPVSFLRRGSGLLTSNAAEAGGFVRSRPTVDRPDLQKAH